MSSTAILLKSSPSALKPTNQNKITSSSSSSSSQINSNNQQQTTPKSIINTPKPKAQTPTHNITPLPAQAGTWRHPRINDIARRQGQSAFNSQNVWIAIQNGGFLIISLFLPSIITSIIPRPILDPILTKVYPYNSYFLIFLRLFFLGSFLFAFKPLLIPKDDMEDIPLTPSQRALLGLKPSNTPLSTTSQTATPPRYSRSRSTTPKSIISDRGSSPSTSSNASPLDDRGRRRSGSVENKSLRESLRAGSNSGSPYGGNGSPLVQKTLIGNTERRLSFDMSVSDNINNYTSQIGNGKASVGLNNKWLYERGRSSPIGRSIFS